LDRLEQFGEIGTPRNFVNLFTVENGQDMKRNQTGKSFQRLHRWDNVGSDRLQIPGVL